MGKQGHRPNPYEAAGASSAVQHVRLFLGGLALVAAALWLRGDARLVTWFARQELLPLRGNCESLATRRANPGWILMMIALALMVTGAARSSG